MAQCRSNDNRSSSTEDPLDCTFEKVIHASRDLICIPSRNGLSKDHCEILTERIFQAIDQRAKPAAGYHVTRRDHIVRSPERTKEFIPVIFQKNAATPMTKIVEDRITRPWGT